MPAQPRRDAPAFLPSGASGRLIAPVVLCLALATLATGCPKEGPGGQTPSAGSALDPEACGQISTSDVGRKLYAFLRASKELDSASVLLEGSMRQACQQMAVELGVSPDGSTRELCKRVTDELRASLEVSVSKETRAVTRYTPPVCTTDVELGVQFAAQCEARAAADINMHCEGRCGGTCSGACDGTCTATAADGSCAGECQGTCRGACQGQCDGYTSVNASAECRASADITTALHTTCTEPKVEVVYEDVAVIDATRLQRAVRAIQVGLPTILRVGVRAQRVGKALVAWVKTTASLAAAGNKLAGEIGERGACVVAQIVLAVAASVEIQARIDISVNVYADVSAAAGAHAE